MDNDKNKTLEKVFGNAGISFNKKKINKGSNSNEESKPGSSTQTQTKSPTNPAGTKGSTTVHRDIVGVITGVYDKTTDFFNNLRKDSEAQLEAKFNDPARKDGVITSHGDVPKLLSFFSDSVKFILDNLDKVPNVQGKFQRSFTDDFRLELEDVKKTLNVVKKAGTIGDVYSTVLSVRQVFVRLATTQKIFDIEPGLANLIDMTKMMRWEDPRSGLSSYFKYNEIGDATIQPDSLLVKPIFLLLVDENLKRRLTSLHVSQEVINFLGNYSVPSYFLSNELAPAVDGSHLTSTSDTLKTVETFNWSLNGLKPYLPNDTTPSNPSVASLTLEDYRKVNDQFIREVTERFNTADAGLFSEYTIDLAVIHTLSLWLNAAFKVLVESNMQLMPEINKGVNFDKERLLTIDHNSLLLKLLFEVNDKVDSSSPLPLLFKRINSKLAEQLGEKLPYSDYAYKFLIKEFKTITVSVSAPLHQYYLASNLLGEHKSKIIIAPKLYLPVNLKASHPIDVKVIGSDGKIGIYTHTDAFNMMVNINRSFYIPNRDATVNATITIVTPLKLLINMSKTAFNGLVDKFMSSESIRSNDSSTKTFASIFASSMAERRTLSAIPPFFYKNRFTGIMKAAIPVSTKSKYVWPFMDAANMKDTVENDSAYTIETAYKLGDYIRAYFNMHGDFSWIEMGIAYTMLTHGNIKGVRPVKKSGDTITFTGTMLSASIEYDPASNTYTPESTATAAGSAFVVEFRSLVRVYYYTLKFVLKEKDGKSISLDNFDMFSQKNMKPTLISKDDVYDAYRYVIIKQDSDYLIVDNKVNKRDKKDLFLTTDVANGDTASGIVSVTKLLKSGEQLKITESDVVSQILSKDWLDKSFLIYDENPTAVGEASVHLEYEPVLIVGTDLVGYRLTGKGSNITNHTEFINNNPNMYVYLTKNFLPFFISHLVVLPTNGKRATEANGYIVNQLKPAFLSAHILSLFGVLEGNYSDSLKVLGTGFGLQGDLLNMLVNPKTTMDITNYSGDRKEYGSTTDVWYLPKDLAKLEMSGDIPVRSYGNINVNTRGIVSSTRYPSYLYIDVDQYNTGLPIHAGSITRVSIEKTRAYYSALNSVIESGAVTQRLNEDVKGSISLVKIQAGASSDNKWDRRIFITPRKIIAILGMEDPNYESK